MAARQRREVGPRHLAVRLRAQPRKDACVGQPVIGIDARGAPRPEHGLDRDAADIRRLHRAADDRTDLVVVDAEGRSHGESGEDARFREALDGALLETTDVGAAVVLGGLRALPVVLEVHLHALAMALERRDELVVLRDAQPVRVQQDPHDGAGHEMLEQLLEPRVQRRLAAAQHQDVEPAVLALEAGIHRCEHRGERCDRCRLRARLGEAGGAAKIAVIGQVLQEDARVLRLHLGSPSS